MERGNVGHWPQTQNILLNHFCGSTIQFLWEESAILSSIMFQHCIILQCVILNIDFIRIQQSFKTLRDSKTNALAWMLQSNSQITFNQRFTSKDILLVSDSIFPSQRFGQGVLQTGIDRNYRYVPMKIPTVILLETVETSAGILEVNKRTRIIISEMTTAMLIFVDSDRKLVSMGCFTCEGEFEEHYAQGKLVPMYPVSFKSVPMKLLAKFEILQKFWRNVNSKMRISRNKSTKGSNCNLISSRHTNDLILFEDETCETFNSFFETKNCSNFIVCKNYFFDDRRLRLIPSETVYFKYLSEIFPFVLKQTDFTFQVLVPKVHVLEAGLGAYLTPFEFKIWICTIISIIAIFLWLWRTEGEDFTLVLFWQFAVFVEQDGPEFNGIRFGGKTMVLMWMMIAILLRLFYTASLYSFMTAEKEPDDYPQTIPEVVKTNDFDLLVTLSFSDKFGTWFWPHPLNHQPRVRDLYFGVITKAFVMTTGSEIQILQNASFGQPANVQHYLFVNRNVRSSREFFSTHWFFPVEKRFSKFVTLCEGDCNSNSNVGLVGQKAFHRIIPQQSSPLLQSFEFWTLRYTNFATLSFPKYFGSFVHSGLYELSIKRYRLLNQFKNILQLNEFRALGMSNSSLFSFVFLANQKEVFIEEEDPTKLSALEGTLLLGTLMLSTAFAVFLFELQRYIQKWICKPWPPLGLVLKILFPTSGGRYFFPQTQN
ncbi:unnamed protein product [Orchesella dallaii]|uniref:Ionotropic receptor n=1 Tax=Orchesella dallaii TaxID=48710 RepID=A0ABP1RHP7_9HEXA